MASLTLVRGEYRVCLRCGYLFPPAGRASGRGWSERVFRPNIERQKWQTGLSERIAGQLFARFAAQGLDVIYGMADNQAAAIV